MAEPARRPAASPSDPAPPPPAAPAVPPGRQPVAATDALWLQDSATNRMIINGLYTVDRMDLDTLRRLFVERVLAAEGGARWPRFMLRVVEEGGRPFWEPDPEFAIERHILAAPGGEAVRTKADLQRYLGGLVAQPLPADRPRWQFLHIPELDGGKTAFIVRVHHSMGDGIGLIPVLFSLEDAPGESKTGAPAPGDAARDPALKVARKPRSRLGTALKLPFAFPVVLLGKLLARADKSPVHGPELSGEKRVAWSEAIPFSRIQAIKGNHGASVNDVLLTAVVGAFRRVVAAAGGELARLHASVPVNVRAAGEPLRMENRFAAVPFDLPAHIADARERIREVHRRMLAMKDSVEPIVVHAAQSLLTRALPPRASTRLIDVFANKCTCVLTNVPGPSHQITLAGRRIHDLMFWVPQRSRIGIGISLLSFSGTLRLGVISDARVMPDPDLLVAGFEQELRELEGAAGPTRATAG
jgi:WS/DGAT/MGAT family acyltransferase